MAVRKLELMHRQFGRFEAHLCGECSNLIAGRYHDKTYRKCKVYGLTHSQASDWAKRWTACGMYNKTYTGRPIINLVRPEKKTADIVPDEPLEGQMKMEG